MVTRLPRPWPPGCIRSVLRSLSLIPRDLDQLVTMMRGVEWQVDAKALHREFDRAKKEFRKALAGVVAFHSPGTAADIEERCSELLAIVS